jgi:hypothetical protein
MLLNLNICNNEFIIPFWAYKKFTIGVLALVIENIDSSEAKINGATTIVTFIKFVDSKNISNIIVKYFKYRIWSCIKMT